MTKEKVADIALEKSKLLLEYIENFIACQGTMAEVIINWDGSPYNEDSMCYIEIILDSGARYHINTGISAQQSNFLCEQILFALAERYVNDKNVEITSFFTIISKTNPKCGINIMGIDGTLITLNFMCRGIGFDKVIENYSRKLIDEKNRIRLTR